MFSNANYLLIYLFIFRWHFTTTENVLFQTMNNNIIPLRHSSLLGNVRLPKRYETTEDIHSDRKGSVSLQSPDEPMNERLDDLAQAMVWVKHELVSIIKGDHSNTGLINMNQKSFFLYGLSEWRLTRLA